MDRYTHDIDQWGQACLGSEPIYCDGPSPLNSDDIICPGSDDGTDEATKVAKKLRYEEHGRRYLQGRPLRILSASLHGPFNKASGWQNPWLPNLPSQHVRCLENPSQSPPASSVARYGSNIPVDRLSGEEDGTIQDVDDSMECHLPSPQSHEDLQFFDSPSHERHSQIESWAENVHRGVLEKDKFWAPDHDSVDRNAESAQKRPVGRDWLKRRPEKRRKLPASQSTGATSTPTPTPTAPLRAKRSKNLVIGKRSANRSFEITTPSSSPGQGPRESPNLVERQPVASYGEYGQPVSSILPTGDTRTSAEPTVRSREEEEKGAEEDNHEREDEQEGENAGMFEDKNRCQPQRQTSHSHEETEETSSFENCADKSFCYRARQSKQATPQATSNATVADHRSQQTKTEVAILPTHDDGIVVSSSSDTRKSNLNTTRDVKHAERLNQNSSSITINDESDHSIVSALQSDHSLLQSHEAIVQGCSSTDPNTDTANASRVNVGRPLGDITSNKRTSRLNIRNNEPQTVLELKEARVMSPEPSFDEEITLIGDPMDMEEPGDIELVQQNPDHHFSGGSFLQHYAISATRIVSASQRSQCYDITPPSKTDNAASCAMTTIPQQEPAELQLMTTQPPIRSSREEFANSIAGAEAISGQDNEDVPQVMTESQTAPPKQQSPWVPLCTIKESFQPGNDNIERDEDEVKNLPAQPIATLLHSPALVNYSPAIRPSQQSPWLEEAAEPANTTRLEGTVGMGTAVIMNIELPEKLPSPLLPEHQEHTWTAPSSAIPPISSNPSQGPRGTQYLESNIIPEEEALLTTRGFPDTPVPQIARQSTPDGEVSIRSFSNFNFSSPQQSLCPPSSSACRSILSSRKYLSARTSTKSTRRVLFAPLPHDQEDDSNQFSTKLRAASPPPPALVNLEEENVDGKYRKHFDVMNRRISVCGTPTLRYHQRLLPSSSQQKPESPSVEAMARAFREADAQRLDHADNVAQGSKADEEESGFEEVEERPQSPWQHDTQGTDDVAAVMGNLNQFLDVWDIDTEINRNRAELNGTGTHEAPSNSDMSILQEVSIW
ncbi:hypothetical protein F4824DRAFT_448110 [Ustulina deusta]|nr:hypothetical protein F4824DRAFT_448110 [Ustulina deusta]